MEWISVEDRLPDCSLDVLVTTFKDGHWDYWIGWYHRDLGWILYSDDGDVQSITHWAEIKPPTPAEIDAREFAE